MSVTAMDGRTIKENVRRAYARVAQKAARRAEETSRYPSSCCAPDQTAQLSCSSLYSVGELEGLPASVIEASAGCGNPTALAELQPGEVVLDLGSGGGIDCLLAARKVGERGHVIGLDMTPEMIGLARSNADKVGFNNVEFRLGEMEEIPLEDGSVDVVISNCVINLSPDKDAVFREAYRVLRLGGRLAISDIVTEGELPAQLRDMIGAWTGCLAGALDEGDYLNRIRKAGFSDVEVTSRAYVDPRVLTDSTDVQEFLRGFGESLQSVVEDLAGKVVSVKVRAYKPASA